MPLTLISTHNVTSAVSSLAITSGLDDTYDSYEFHCYNLVTGTAWDGKFGFQFNAASGSNTSGFNQVITSTHNTINRNEGGTSHNWNYNNSWDLTSANKNITEQNNQQLYQAVNRGQFSNASGNDGYTPNGADYLVADGTSCGVIKLYNPASTTYVKHFMADFATMGGVKSAVHTFHHLVAGYVNTTAALDEISFKYHNGTWGSGTIYMYGVS
jgi:hypothetical protein